MLLRTQRTSFQVPMAFKIRVPTFVRLPQDTPSTLRGIVRNSIGPSVPVGWARAPGRENDRHPCPPDRTRGAQPRSSVAA